jgi:hypothetical protein
MRLRREGRESKVERRAAQGQRYSQLLTLPAVKQRKTLSHGLSQWERE